MQVFVATTRFNVEEEFKTQFEQYWSNKKDELQESHGLTLLGLNTCKAAPLTFWDRRSIEIFLEGAVSFLVFPAALSVLWHAACFRDPYLHLPRISVERRLHVVEAVAIVCSRCSL